MFLLKTKCLKARAGLQDLLTRAAKQHGVRVRQGCARVRPSGAHIRVAQYNTKGLAGSRLRDPVADSNSLQLSRDNRILLAMIEGHGITKPRIAAMHDPTIRAVVEGLFRLESEALALKKLAWVGKHFIRAREQDAVQEGEPSTLRLWIAGFAVTREEKAQGYRGHYARLAVAAIDGGRYTIRAEKLPVELARHPQKAPPKLTHPNRGHPVMRAVEAGKVYSSITSAREKLTRFHEEFSAVTTPGNDVLHVRLYNRNLLEGGMPPIEKITIAIQPVAEGRVKLVIRKPSARKKPEDKKKASESKGKFTAMLKQRLPRKSHRKNPKST
jgi:hypothetical protein